MGPIDPGEIEDLIREHAARLVLYARQWTLDPEDIVQEALLRLARNPQRPDDCVAWLFRTVRNLGLNDRRNRQRRAGREQDFRRERPSWFECDPAVPIDAASASAALARLDSAQREVVVLRIWCGQTYAEIGALVGISAASAYRQYVDGLRQLQSLLRPFESPRGNSND